MDHESFYKTCVDCVQVREKNDFAAALQCKTCNGTGIIRKSEAFICNKCGQSLLVDNHPYGLVDSKVSGGYQSYHLTNYTTYVFSVCEKCLRELFGEFKIPPSLCNDISIIDYKDDLAWYKYQIWCDAGGQLEKLQVGVCNYNEHCLNEAEWREYIHGNISDKAVCTKHKIKSDDNIFVPQSKLSSLPIDKNTRTYSDKQLIALEFITVAAGEKLTLFKYIPGCIVDLLLSYLDKDACGIWVPVSCSLPEWVKGIYLSVPLTQGTFVIGTNIFRKLCIDNRLPEAI